MHQTRRAGSAAPYAASIGAFLGANPAEVLGILTAAHPHDQLDAERTRAWQAQIAILQRVLAGLDGWLFLEFDVPREKHFVS